MFSHYKLRKHSHGGQRLQSKDTFVECKSRETPIISCLTDVNIRSDHIITSPHAPQPVNMHSCQSKWPIKV